MKRKCFLFAASMLMFSSMIYDAKANEEYVEAPTVVISATRTEQLIEDVPAAMEVITADDIARLGAQDVVDALQKGYGIVTQGTSGGVSIRGASAKILINGRSPVVYGSPNETVRRTLDLVPAENIERIEILRGPASALYGDGLGAIVNIITKESSKRETTLGFTMGTEDYSATLRHDTGKVGNWSNIFSAEFYRYWGSQEESISTGVARERIFMNDMYMNNSLAYTFDGGNVVQLDTNYLFKEGDDSNSRSYDESVLSNILSYEGDWGDHFYNAAFSHSQTTRRGTERVTVVSFDAQDSWIINDMHTLTFGTKLEWGNANGPRNEYTDPSNRSTASYGFYLQDEISLFDEKLYLVPALRYDHYESFGGHLSPKIGMTYEYLPNHRFKASWGTSYRAPNVTELFGSSSGGYGRDIPVPLSARDPNAPAGATHEVGFGTTLPTPDLKPETSQSWEVRLEGDFDHIPALEGLSYGVGYFHTEYKDKIDKDYTNPVSFTLDEITKNGVYEYEVFLKSTNLGKVRTQGIEAELYYDFLEYFTAGIRYTYLDSRNLITNTTDGPAAYNEFQASLDFNYTPWDLYASLWGTYFQNFKDGEWGKDRFDYYKVNFSISKVFNEKYTVSFIANNFLQTARANSVYDLYLNPAEYKLHFQIKF